MNIAPARHLPRPEKSESSVSGTPGAELFWTTQPQTDIMKFVRYLLRIRSAGAARSQHGWRVCRLTFYENQRCLFQMDVTLLHFIIACPMTFLAGFVDAVAGGGGLISLPGFLVTGLPVHVAIATNKMSSSMGTALATYKYARAGYVKWKLALTTVIFAFAGSWVGARLLLVISDDIVRLALLLILPATGFYVTKAKIGDDEEREVLNGRTCVVSCILAFLIGIYDGFYGPGTGTFLLLGLTALAHLKVSTANGVTKVINLTTNLAALTVFLINGKVLLALGLAAGVSNMLGNYAGAEYFKRRGAASVKPLLVVVLTIFFVKTLYEVLNA